MKEKLARLAHDMRDVDRGFGGYGTNVGTLTQFCNADYGTIVECLKQLHSEGRIYLQNWVNGRFRPWNTSVSNVFFNDFRLLNEKPVCTR